tara:strand:- start:606 stop:2210 length:1605 start_codon:yes stop_codon:yes gene_type:complete
MAVQITGRQIANAAVGVAKLDLSTGTFDFQSAVLQVATPSADSHAATKGYVDSISQGLHWKDSVKVATTANITLSGTQTIDGVAVSADQRVLVKNQSSGAENGIYLCKAGAWERAADMNESDEFSGSAVFVQEGSVNADSGYVCTNDGAVTVGSTAITFAQFTGAGQVEAGAALTKTGNRLDVAVDDSSIEISSDALQVKAAGITNAMLAGSIANGKLANSTISGVSLGANLNSLSAGNGLSMTSYNGSAAVSDLTIDLDGSTLAVGSDGIKVADGGIGASQLAADAVVSAKIADGAIDSAAYIADSLITNAKLAGSIANGKLANSTISGVALGGNLNSLSAGNGLSMTSYNGSAAVSDLTINLDGATLSVGSDGLKIAAAGVGATQLASAAVTTAKIADDAITAAKIADGAVDADRLASSAVTTAKIAADAITNAKIADDAVQTENLNFAGFFAAFDANGSTAAFELGAALDLEFREFFVVTVNGLVMEYKDTPDAQDNYKIDNAGSGGVGRILFGSNLSANDRVTIRGFINN